MHSTVLTNFHRAPVSPAKRTSWNESLLISLDDDVFANNPTPDKKLETNENISIHTGRNIDSENGSKSKSTSPRPRKKSRPDKVKENLTKASPPPVRERFTRSGFSYG